MPTSTGGVYFGPTSKLLVWTAFDEVYAKAELPLEAKVLEIGGGNDPHPASDVIVDKFVDDNLHRMGQTGMVRELRLVTQFPDGLTASQVKRVPIVQADGVALPFPDKAFDFVIAKDVIEHIPDVRAALAEISRVGKSGYLDVPKLESEFLFPQGPIHEWVFHDEGGQLVARSVKGFESPFGRTMHDLFAEHEAVRRAWAKSRRYFHLVRFWRDAIDCRVAGHVQDTLF